jgi:hypothetical protein
MKITIDIPEMYIPILSKWASVSRTLRNGQNIAYEFLLLTDDMNLQDKAHIFIEEIDQICQALDTLHHLTRSELWEENKNATD